MRKGTNEPGRQLHSVALRCRHGWLQCEQRRPGWWRFDPPAGGATTDRPSDAGVRDPKVQRLEAVLFLAREPLTSRKLSVYANLADGTEARTLIRRLNQWYDQRGRAFRVEEVAGGYQLLSRPKFAGWLRRLAHVPAETRLSAPVLETLAVIAYRQPVLRADIEAIRGVNCGEILRQLMERDLVRISGRSQELGRPYLYATTKTFLQLFGLPNIDKLPRVETMRNISEDADLNRPVSLVAETDGPLEGTETHLSHSKREESDVTRTTREFAHHDNFEEEAPSYASVIRDQDDEEVEEFEDDADDLDEDEEEEFEDDDLEGEDDFEAEDDELEDEEEEEFEEEGEDDFEDEDWEEVEDDEDEEDDDWDDEDDDWDDDEEEEEEEEEEWD
jgi:segregation and condensation protein B